MRYTIALCLLLASTLAHADVGCTKMAYAGVVADMASTSYTLDQPGTYEHNPLYGKHPSDLELAVGTAVGVGVAYTLDRLGYEKINCLFAVAEFALAGNNMAIASGNEDHKLGAAAAGAAIPVLTFTFEFD